MSVMYAGKIVIPLVSKHDKQGHNGAIGIYVCPRKGMQKVFTDHLCAFLVDR